jgi:hypothetical protein
VNVPFVETSISPTLHANAILPCGEVATRKSPSANIVGHVLEVVEKVVSCV